MPEPHDLCDPRAAHDPRVIREVQEEKERRLALRELMRWAPQMQAQFKKLERWTNRAVGEYDDRIDGLQATVDRREKEGEKLRYQLTLAQRQIKDQGEQLVGLRAEIRGLRPSTPDTPSTPGTPERSQAARFHAPPPPLDRPLRRGAIRRPPPLRLGPDPDPGPEDDELD